MKFCDTFVGKDGKTLSSYIHSATIIDLVELTSSSEVQKKLEQIKKSLSKNSSATYLVVAFRT